MSHLRNFDQVSEKIFEKKHRKTKTVKKWGKFWRLFMNISHVTTGNGIDDRKDDRNSMKSRERRERKILLCKQTVWERRNGMDWQGGSSKGRKCFPGVGGRKREHGTCASAPLNKTVIITGVAKMLLRNSKLGQERMRLLCFQIGETWRFERKLSGFPVTRIEKFTVSHCFSAFSISING